MATTYRIHPAIGVARVGNSPDGFHVGPERPGQRPDPDGGFKDADCRDKRQAARFRVYAHHDDGTAEEVTAGQADIAWTVHLANRKAAFPGRGNTEPAPDLTIDPGPRTVDRPGQRAIFDTGTIRFAGQQPVTVPLGEIRTEDTGRLLVLGGAGTSASPAGNGIGSFWGNEGWFDDVSDGPVTATVTLRTGETPDVEGAWVLVTPPKFAPHQDSVVTLWDRLFARMVELGFLPTPTSTSYTRDVYPILQRARDTRWVKNVSTAHSWTDPVTTQRLVDRIVGRIRPAGNMPQLNGDDSQPTAVQAAHLQRWKAGTYTNDWTGEPTPGPEVTPDGLDRAALEACVGGAFFPGIEAGGLAPGQRPILEARYAAAFRLDHAAVAPGTISAAMALPWQADFEACGDNWWPVPRPNDVLDVGGGTLRWDRDVASMDAMVDAWHTLGFVVRQGDRYVETGHCPAPAITLRTPHLAFTDTPAGPLGMVREAVLAIGFDVGTAATLELDPPTHPQLVALTPAATGPGSVELRVAYRTGVAPSALPTQTLTVRNPADGQTWLVTVDANTVARPTVGVALVLDRSGSMRRDGRHARLARAAGSVLDLALPGDSVDVVGFNDEARPLDLREDPAGLAPEGGTSVGDGLAVGRTLLGASGHDARAMLVVTDGVENRPRWLADVAPQVVERTHAVGIGAPNGIGVPGLAALTANTGGALLVTGDRDPARHVLQAFASIVGAEVVTGVDAVAAPETVARLPFALTDADGGFDVVVLTTDPAALDVRLQTPTGQLIEPWLAAQQPAMRFGVGTVASYFRVALPVQLQPGRFDQAGTWNVLVTPGAPRLEPSDGVDVSILRGVRPRAAFAPPPVPAFRSERERAFAVVNAPPADVEPRALVAETPGAPAGVPFTVFVHAWSAVSLAAVTWQDSYAPGAEVRIGATLTESGLPVGEPVVTVEITRPTGATVTQPLDDLGGGEFGGSFTTTQPGAYQVLVRARGRTRTGQPFTREQLTTASAWVGQLLAPREG